MCRALKASEIDVRVQSIKTDKDGTCKGAILLLYKNARVDMDLLDDEYGPLGWQRTHAFKDGKLYCTVSVWDKEKQMWISREDVGTESNTEAEKGQASDAFKRACTNFLPQGRALYTAPLIYIKAEDFNHYDTGRKSNNLPVYASNDSFSVGEIEIKDNTIMGLSIRNDKSKAIVFTYGTVKGSNSSKPQPPKQTPTKTENEPKTAPVKPVEALAFEIADGITVEMLFKQYKNDIDSVYEQGTEELKKAIDTVREYIKACKK